VPPHFTLVFPVTAIDEASLIRHTRRVAEESAAINFRLRTALAVKDPLSEATHVFLVPEEGFAAIVRLHDRLLTGPLADALRLDIPFIPHVTVAAFADAALAKSLADDLNGQPIAIDGEIGSITTVRYDRGAVTTIDRVDLHS
jgi:hypothetical protein